MTFRSRNPNSRFFKMGDDASKGELREAEGLLIDIQPSPRFPKNPLYTIQRDDGTKVSVAGTTTINKHLRSSDIGKRIRLKYRGEVSSGSDMVYRDVEVIVEDDPQDGLTPEGADLPVQVAGVNEDGAINDTIPLPETAPEEELSSDLPW